MARAEESKAAGEASPTPWGLESIKKILGFGQGLTKKPVTAQAEEQLLVFQRKLCLLAETPCCFTKPHPEHGDLRIDFSQACDLDAAMELTRRVGGVSRWKPNLVPRLVSEQDFFSNFFGFVAATADEHFSDEKNLQYFYSDDDDAAKVAKAEEAASPQPQAAQPSEPAAPAAPAAPVASSPAPDAAAATAPAATAGATAGRFANALPAGASTPELVEQFNGKNVLFYIERSNNNNTVVYEANMVDGKLNETDPVRVYWIMYSADPVHEEELNMIERNTAYGSTTQPDPEAGPGHFTVTLSALRSRAIKVWQDEAGALHATASVDGEQRELMSIFVETTTSWGFPSVKHIDIRARQSDGAFVTERMTA